MTAQRRDLMLSSLTAFGSALLFVLIRTDVHTYDALSYVLDVDRKPWQELFHPHHLAYGPLGALLRTTAVAFGWSGTVEPLLQTLNGVAGGLTIGLLTMLLLQLTQRPAAALLAAAAVAVSHAFWYYAGEIEVYTLAALGLVLFLGLLLQSAAEPTPRAMVGLAAAQAVAVLFHQTNVLLTPVLLAALLPALRAQPAPGRPAWIARLLLPYLAVCTLVIGGSYLWVAFGVSRLTDLSAVIDWLFSYARTGFWGGVPQVSLFSALFTGWSRTFAPQFGSAALLVALLLFAAARRAPQLAGGRAIALLSWLLIYSVFFAWWEADNIEFWIAVLPPLAVGWAVALDRLAIAQPRLPILPIAAAALLLLAVSNGFALRERGDAARDLQRAISSELIARTQPGDLLIVPDGVLELYLPHYGQRNNVYSLSQAMNENAADWPAACAAILQRATTVQRAGFAVLIAADAVTPPPAPPGEPPTPAERYRLDPATVAACYAPLLPMSEPLQLTAGAQQYQQIAAAEQLAGSAAGWDFSRGMWGWQVDRVQSAVVTDAGLQLVPEIDPALSSPPLQLDPAQTTAVEITLAVETAARDLQLFLLDAAGQASEAAALRAVLQPGSQVQTVRLNLADAAALPNVIGGLRLDPIGSGDGQSLTLLRIRVISRAP
jgi:hypothetical protein